MDRRDFVKMTGAAAGTLMAAAAFAGRAVAQPGLGRRILPINRGWRYAAKSPVNGHDPAFDDSALARVTVPHTNIPLPWHGFDDKDYQFVSLYRRRLRVPPLREGARVFVDFEGVMTAATVWINGARLGEHKGGYTPFSFEITNHVREGDNLLAVDVDSTERSDIPPFGNLVDYLTFGGIYREVALRIVPRRFIENIAARPRDVLAARSGLDVACFLQGQGGPMRLEAVLRDANGRTLARATRDVPASQDDTPQEHIISFAPLNIRKWDIADPYLHTVEVRLLEGGALRDNDARRFGFRTAEFTGKGFFLNGRHVKLRGLNRHQTFPFVGQAMGARGQRRDAWILRKDLHCNIVRTSHYPQSRHFLDACDELGLLVLEEIPGWQHIGDAAWQDVAVNDVRGMIRRDWNHPSIVLWGTRINESADNRDFYTRTNATAKSLDPTRQTGGIRNRYQSELLEDVFTMNDFGWPLRPPNHPRYLITEFGGHTYPVKSIDDDVRHREHTIRHARVHDQVASGERYAGAIAWCAFDYNTHAVFGAGDRICYHGVLDIFREPKPAAGFYKSQVEPEEEIVLEPAFHWAPADEATHFSVAMVCSNCDHIKFSVFHEGQWKPMLEADPDRAQFPHLKYPPFSPAIPASYGAPWGDLRIDGYIKGKLVISKTYSGRGVDRKFELRADDTQLLADGMDATRVVMRITDEFGAIRPFANDAITLQLEGPAELIGDNPFALSGGTGAVWVRAGETPGRVRLTATHARLGSRSLDILLQGTAPESA